MSETPCLRIPKCQGEKGLALVKKMGILNREFRVQREQGYLYIPLIREPLATELKQLKMVLARFEVCVRPLLEHGERHPKLVDLLGDKLPPHVLASLPHAIDFIGDVAVVEIAPELESYERIIGEAILMAHESVRTVLAKSGAVSGEYRLREFEVIAGAEKTETVHREHGCVFHVDLAKAYFSPRLSYEHFRVASQVGEDETVLDMFAGVGPFSILTAKKREKVRVYAVDVNPDAFRYLKKNVAANRVEAKVTPILGDVRMVVEARLKGLVDRVIMNLPEKAIEYVEVACEALKAEGGVMHYYEFSGEPNPLETVKNRLAEALKKAGCETSEVLLARVVREIAPYTYQVVMDAKVKRVFQPSGLP